MKPWIIGVATVVLAQGPVLASDHLCEAYFDPARATLSVPCAQVGAETMRAELQLQNDALPEIRFALGDTTPFLAPPVAWRVTELGQVLVDAEGRTLYTFDQDSPSHSNCSGACLEKWPPLTATAAGASRDGFSLVTREDDSLQWAYMGQPLYYWFQDEKPGDTLGDGVNDAWHVVHAPRADTRYATTAIGRVLTASNGMTLYTFDNDTRNQSNCNDDCLTRWPALTAGPGARNHDGYGVITRDDGSVQWAYQGQPLYFWYQDQQPGDTLGDGVGDVWHAVKETSAPVAFQPTEMGTVLAAHNGMTLYTFDKDQPNRSQCTEDCLARWPALTATAEAQGEGAFSVLTREDGSLQWAYRNQPLYFWFQDEKAGDTLGDGVGGVWHVIRR